MKKTLNYQRYKILWAGTSINFIAGIMYMWSVLSKSLIDDLGFTSKQASFPYTVFTISLAIAMVIFGRMQDNKGPRLVATIGCILMGLGLILSGLFTSPTILIFTIGIITGSGVGILNVSTSPPVVKWFPPEKKGVVTGIVVAGVGLSSTMYSPLANYLLKSIGIHKTFIYIGIVALFVSIILAQLLRNPSKDELKRKEEIDGIKDRAIDRTWDEMLKTVSFYKLWIMFAFSSSAGLMIIAHITSIAQLQANWEGGFILVIFLSIFNALGRIMGGWLSDKIGRLNLMKIVFGIQAINMLLFANYSNPMLLGIGVSITGFCYGALFAVFPSAITDVYGLKNFGINFGIIYTGWAFGGIIGPMVAAIIFDSVGNYEVSYIVAAVLLVISIIIAIRFDHSKQKKVENTEEK